MDYKGNAGFFRYPLYLSTALPRYLALENCVCYTRLNLGVNTVPPASSKQILCMIDSPSRSEEQDAPQYQSEMWRCHYSCVPARGYYCSR